MRFRLHGLRSLLPILGLLSACSATVNWNYPRTPSSALAPSEINSGVGTFFQEADDQHPGLSGFTLLQEGSDAFMARVAMADLAEKTLDAQYYIWDGDTTGKILGDRLMRAADRGVRVRILIDDHYITEQKDFRLAALDAHPNVEIRFFNPITHRGSRTMSFLSDFGRANHRMHNKLFIMDNSVGIVGGRNVADIYFGVRPDHNYRDLDVMTTGPLVGELSSAFDTFWNSDWAIPVAAVVKEAATEEDLHALMTQVEKDVAASGYPYPFYEGPDDLRTRLTRVRDRFIWASGRVLAEHPSRVGAEIQSGVIAAGLRQRLSETEHELLIESPYFVLGDRPLEAVREASARGVKVRVLTNSAASNDVVPAHAGYANTRKRLLEAGVELYELRPDTNMKRHWALIAGKSRTALHCKSLVFDRKSVFIGSFNLDPRSATINTEIGVMIDSPEIAGQVGEIMDEGVGPGSAFHVTLDENDNLVWTAESNGQTVRYGKDPEISAWHRFVVAVMRTLPIEDQL